MGNLFPVPTTALLPGWRLRIFLQVEEVIDDGTIAQRRSSRLSHATEEKQASQEGEYPVATPATAICFCFPLSRWRDLRLLRTWSRLIIDGGCCVSNGKKQPLQFGDKKRPVTLEEFIQAVRVNRLYFRKGLPKRTQKIAGLAPSAALLVVFFAPLQRTGRRL